MNCLCVLAFCLTCLCLAAPSCADTLVITYQNGYTQTVPLDGKSSSIQSLHYLSNDAPAGINKPAIPKLHDELSVQDKPETKDVKSEGSVKKPSLRFRWADPVIGQ